MKNTVILLIFALIPGLCFTQNVVKPTISFDKKGKIRNVEFYNIPKTNIPKDANVFFKEYLESNKDDGFIEVPHKSDQDGIIDQHFDQYYKGLKVDGGGYNFHYKNEKMFLAHGHFVALNNFNITPSISPQQAMSVFALYKKIPQQTINSYNSTLIIKEIEKNKGSDTSFVTTLVYKVIIKSNHQNNDEIGYIDAHSGKIVKTESRYDNTSYIGTFETLYSGIKQATTELYNNSYYLADYSRGAFIHTKNCNNSSNIESASELTDLNNYWSKIEFSTNNKDMGLDIHWALQKIYDYLYINYQKNSFNNEGFPINAYIRFQYSGGVRDNASWDRIDNVLKFGEGYSVCKPFASVDIVGHEFGHGINFFQTGWNDNGDQKAMNEGLSDIWGTIFEYHIQPNVIWQIGEQITKNNTCLRNISNPSESGAYNQIASTYLGSKYNNSSDSHVRGGVFSRWFYLLSVGGSGTNDLGNIYSVNGIGLDKAEKLIIKAVYNNYFDQIATYPELRTAIINVAKTLFCDNSKEVKAVTDAWYAVGVGSQYSNPIISIIGDNLICTSKQYNVVNQPANIISSSWSSNNSSFLSVNSSGIATRVNNYNGTSLVNFSFIGSDGCNSSISKEVWIGSPSNITINGPQILLKDRIGTYTVNETNIQGITTFEWDADGGMLPYGSINQSTFRAKAYGCDSSDVICTASNACGGSAFTFLKVFVTCKASSYVVSPNPASTEVSIIQNNDENARSLCLQPKAIRQVQIFNKFGVMILQKKLSSDVYEVKLNISALPKDYYIIKINQGEDQESYPIIKE